MVNRTMKTVDVIVIGAGAAGLMCAIEAGKRGRKTLVLDHANMVGKKILMSGGGRCNFTNYDITPERYLSHNPHFCKSALSRYTQWDFLALVAKHNIPFHEKKLGQLFCDRKAKDIVNMLLAECRTFSVDIALKTTIHAVQKESGAFLVETSMGRLRASSLVVASGGLSIPTMGASPFAYQLAAQFGIKVWPTRAGLVPFTLNTKDKARLSLLSGMSVDSAVWNETIEFCENILFTHRGLSGPALLQLSSYWQQGEALNINLLPDMDLEDFLHAARRTSPQKQLNSLMTSLLPKRLIDIWIKPQLAEKKLADISNLECQALALSLQHWTVKPDGTEGYRTAEVTLGGIDCDALSSKTMEVHQVPGLFYIGEAVDVTGWLGGYNFQWAWSSGWAAGQVV